MVTKKKREKVKLIVYLSFKDETILINQFHVIAATNKGAIAKAYSEYEKQFPRPENKKNKVPFTILGVNYHNGLEFTNNQFI